MNETDETDETASSLASCTAVIVLYVRMSTIARPGEPASKSLVSVQQSPRPLSRPVRIASHIILVRVMMNASGRLTLPLIPMIAVQTHACPISPNACYCYLHLMIAADRRSATPVEACASLPGLSSPASLSCLSFLVSVRSIAGKRAHCKACRVTLCRCQLPHPVPSCPILSHVCSQPAAPFAPSLERVRWLADDFRS